MMEFKVPRSASIQCNICKLADFPTNKSMMDIIWRFHGQTGNMHPVWIQCIVQVVSIGGKIIDICDVLILS